MSFYFLDISEPDVKILAGDEIDSDFECDSKGSYYNKDVHQYRSVLERGVIPDAKTIYALKKQRQMARDIDEFIAIENEVNQDEERSRLLRDDDGDNNDEYEEDGDNHDDDDDDDDEKRINFTVDQESIEREKTREAFYSAQEDDEPNTSHGDLDSDDELDRWEQEQIRKGVGLQAQSQLFSHNQYSDANSNFGTVRTSSQYTVKGQEFHRSKFKSKTIPNHLLKNRPKLSKEEVFRRLNETLTVMKLNIESMEREMMNLKIEKEQCQETIKALEKELPKMKEKYESYRSKHMEMNNSKERPDSNS